MHGRQAQPISARELAPRRIAGGMHAISLYATGRVPDTIIVMIFLLRFLILCRDDADIYCRHDATGRRDADAHRSSKRPTYRRDTPHQ
jgi:hypothetical protein